MALWGSLLIASPRVCNTARHANTGCIACGLYANCAHPRFAVQGQGKKGILLLGEWPTKEEDASGDAFSGKGGDFLQDVLAELGINMLRDCWLLYAVACAPGNAQNKGKIIEYCRPKLWKEIDKLCPSLIIPFGINALNGLIGNRWNESSLGAIERWEGWHIPDREANSWVVPMRSPVLVRIDAVNKALHTSFSKILNDSLELLDEDVPQYKNEEDCVELLTNKADIHGYLEGLLSRSCSIAFDYETTGLRPFREGMKVICIGIADGPDHAVCFPVDKMDHDFWKRVMQAKNIKKIAHNLQFEDLWTRVYFETPVTGWAFDTELATHILDCRKDICRLKFQAYVQFGLIDYSSHLDKFIRSTTEEERKYGANAFNNIMDAPLDQVMQYCAIDCISTYRLYLKQQGELQ